MVRDWQWLGARPYAGTRGSLHLPLPSMFAALPNASSPSEMRPSFGFLRAQIGLAAFYASL
jgi:hypothetical protein